MVLGGINLFQFLKYQINISDYSQTLRAQN